MQYRKNNPREQFATVLQLNPLHNTHTDSKIIWLLTGFTVTNILSMTVT